MLHGGAVDTGDGNYTVSAWPVVAGAYHMSVLVSALEPSRWALGYRQEHLVSVTRKNLNNKRGNICACSRHHPQQNAPPLKSMKSSSRFITATRESSKLAEEVACF